MKSLVSPEKSAAVDQTQYLRSANLVRQTLYYCALYNYIISEIADPLPRDVYHEVQFQMRHYAARCGDCCSLVIISCSLDLSVTWH